ncbi:MAG: hypothetical protein K1X89_28665 [Myxococcaceae bacterium]|nr:hypothetical protein [Myxococcaceae bacterium]
MKRLTVGLSLALALAGCGPEEDVIEGVGEQPPEELATENSNSEQAITQYRYQDVWDYNGFGNAVWLEWTGGPGGLIHAMSDYSVKRIRLDRCLTSRLSSCSWVTVASAPPRVTASVTIPRKGPSWWHVCYLGRDNRWHCPNSNHQHYAQGE